MKFVELSAAKLRSLPKETPFIIPIAAIEQHGDHLPVWTDSLLLGEIVRRVEATLADRILVAPLLWFGNSDHHLDLGGTLSASSRTYLDMLNDLIENALFQGFRRIVLLNGHGGNDVPGKQAIFEVRQRHRDRKDMLLLMATYWALGAEQRIIDPTLYQTEMGHACEWETSMVLAVRPDLVGDYQQLPVIEPGNALRPANRAWITTDRSSIGHIGWPSLATAAKGEALFAAFTQDILTQLEKVIAWDGHSW